MADIPESTKTLTERDRDAAIDLAHALGLTAEQFTSGADVVIAQALARHAAAPPAMDREAVKWRERWYGSGLLKGSAIVDERGNLIAHLGGDQATHAAVTRVVSAHNATLSADAIRQGEGCMKAREEGYRAGYIHVLGLARAGVPTKDFERDVGAYMADFVGGRP